MKKIVFVTDVRFWHQSTGAEQRIFALVQYLTKIGNDVTTLFLAPLGFNESETAREIEKINQTDLRIQSVFDHTPPRTVLEKLHWQAKCIANLFAGNPKPVGKPTRRLDEFASKETSRRVEDRIRKLAPDWVVLEYITLSYLVPFIRKACTAQLAIDTHDILSARCAQFNEHGIEHWVTLGEEDEQKALRLFDLVIAIQQQEAETFRQWLGNESTVVVAGHPAAGTELPRSHTHLRFGFMASNNAANEQALREIQNAWPDISKLDAKAELIVAGSICESPNRLEHPRVTYLGRVEAIESFYSQIDIVLNPVSFGSGLKIKNIEAIGFGIPLVLSAHAEIGLPELVESESPWLITDHESSLADIAVRLCNHPNLLVQLSDNAKRIASKLFSDSIVYQDLLEIIQR